nr:MAG TPA: hypothetical protein [Caudoviricetes sp.]
MFFLLSHSFPSIYNILLFEYYSLHKYKVIITYLIIRIIVISRKYNKQKTFSEKLLTSTRNVYIMKV